MDVAELERRMRPGARSDCGFLGAEESLHEVLASDAATLAELGVTARELANTLGLLVTAPDAVSAPRFHDRYGPQPTLDPLRLEQHGETVFAAVVERFGSLEFPRRHVALVAKHYVVKLNLYLGIQECPWGPTEGKLCGAASRDWQIRNTARGLEMSGSELIAHLIGEHAFFEGHASPYRTDPRALAELLDLA